MVDRWSPPKLYPSCCGGREPSSFAQSWNEQLSGPWAFGAAISLYLVRGFSPSARGPRGEAVPSAFSPHRGWTAAFSFAFTATFSKTPFHMLSIAFLYGSAVLFAMHGATFLAPALRRGPGRSIRSPTAAPRRDGGPCSGDGAWVSQRIHGTHPRWAWWFAVLTVITGAIGFCSPAPLKENWYLWGMKHGIVPPYPPLGPTPVLDPMMEGAK
ncbi:MAG: hypothetical protein CM15mP103_03170 [Gammaproteobacteria bacterium]|nr:MAG: hypothetical protein CM15mP103_03170 [Gammaproteobacteria bacterium]